jgi:hypothetical protein
MKQKSLFVQIILLSGVIVLFISCENGPIRFERYRHYVSYSLENYYGLSKDVNNSVFDKYTINDTKFILLAEPYDFDADREDIKKGTTGGAFLIHIYRRNDEPVLYRLVKARINTSSFSMDIFDFKYNEAIFDSPEKYNRTDGYKVETLLSSYYSFPCPKDMKYSITVFIEEKDASGVKIEYEFRYDYYLRKNDNWFRWLI